jgi:hypothetical protein
VNWLRSLSRRVRVELLIAALALAVIAFFFVRALFVGSLETEARISANRADAAIESGKDASNSVGEVGARAQASDALTRSNEQEIRNAPGADEDVDPGVADAGRDSLCRRAAYRDRPECVQRAAARGVE